MKLDTKAKFARGRYLALEARPYLATALYARAVVEREELPRVFVFSDPNAWSPKIVDALPNCEEVGHAVSHELGHILFETERRARVHMTFDEQGRPIACDRNRFFLAACLAINSWLDAGEPRASQFRLPEGKTAEWYYANLPPGAGEQECSCAQGNAVADGPEAEAMRAATAGMMPGTESSDEVLSFVERYRVRFPWEKIVPRTLMSTVQAASRGDLPTYTRMPRRAQTGPVRLPGKKQAPLPRVGVLIDTSGSVDDSVRSLFAAVLRPLLNVATFHLVSTDTEVKGYGDIATWSDVVPLIRGGGGTDFCAAFDHFAKRKEKLAAVYVLTDGFATVPATCPVQAPVFWCIAGDAGAPATWGTRIRIEAPKR